MIRIVLHRHFNITIGEITGGVPLPFGALPANFCEASGTIILNDIPKRFSGFNGLKLIGIAHEHQFTAALLQLFGNAGQLSGANHSGFINDNNITATDGLIAACPQSKTRIAVFDVAMCHSITVPGYKCSAPSHRQALLVAHDHTPKAAASHADNHE